MQPNLQKGNYVTRTPYLGMHNGFGIIVNLEANIRIYKYGYRGIQLILEQFIETVCWLFVKLIYEEEKKEKSNVQQVLLFG